MDGDFKEVIFIGGSSYSGSTMLNMMANSQVSEFSNSLICRCLRKYYQPFQMPHK